MFVRVSWWRKKANFDKVSWKNYKFCQSAWGENANFVKKPQKKMGILSKNKRKTQI